MVLYLKCEVQGTGLQENEKLVRKIQLARHFINSLNVDEADEELWYGPPIKSLDGRLAKKGEVLEEVNRISPQYVNTYSYMVRGVYKENPITITVHNRVYSRAYGHLHISSDILDNVINDEKAQSDIVNVISEANSSDILKGVKILICVIGKSPDALEDVRERYMSFYYDKWRLISDLFKTMALESEEVKNPRLVDLLKPYNNDYLSKQITRIPEFEHFLEFLSKESKIKQKAGSIYMIGESQESFKNAYLIFRDDFFNNIKDEWNDDKVITGLFKKWLGRYKSLDDY